MTFLAVVLSFIVVPLALTVWAPRWRVAAAASLAGSATIWALIARNVYHLPIPMNEPEWWGGLAIALTSATIGVAIGALIRHRQGNP